MVLPTAHDGPASRCIQDGDLVIVYESVQSVKGVYVDKSAVFQNRFGVFPQKDWVGKPFGVRIVSRPPQCGWLHLLAPTPELWSLALRHRTQILYAADIALVIAGLDLAPGALVLESGTGSGSLSHSLARAVAPGGKLLTYEFHPQRAQEAEQEFAANGLDGMVAVTQRNIEEAGFPEQLAGSARGVFLDLPAPWKVVPSAAASLAPDGRFCSFSPCMEQVQRTVEALDCHGFTDISTKEILLRNHEVTTEAFLTKVSLPVVQAERAARDAAGPKRKREPRPEVVGDAGDAVALASSAAARVHGSAAADAAGNVGALTPLQQRTGADDEGGGASGAPETSACGCADNSPAAAAPAADAAGAAANVAAALPRVVVARPSMDARGHTGYLTFARKFVVATPPAV